MQYFSESILTEIYGIFIFTSCSLHGAMLNHHAPNQLNAIAQGETKVKTSRRSLIFAALLESCLPLVAGCWSGPQADYGKLGLVEVAGTISLDGQPVPKAAIFFYGEDNTYSYGITDESGRYVAMLNSKKSGVIPGEKKIEISTVHSPVPGGLSGDGADLEGDPDAPVNRKRKGEKIPDCYNIKTKLKVDISSSDRGMDFDLKSDCSTTAPS